jgi:uncharacterized membrane protein
MRAAEGSVSVNAPVADVYQRWLRFEDYPKFITAIKRVQKSDAKHFLALVGFKGKQYETRLEIMLRVPERRLAWRTVSDGSTPVHLATGVVSFASDPDGSTRVSFKLNSSFGGAVGHRVQKYLRNFKTLVESRRD